MLFKIKSIFPPKNAKILSKTFVNFPINHLPISEKLEYHYIILDELEGQYYVSKGNYENGATF